MTILNDINSSYKSPALTSGTRVLKWSIWTIAKIRFNQAEVDALEDYNFDDLTSPLVYDLHPGELELINSEIIEPLPEIEIRRKYEELRTEMNAIIREIQDQLIEEFDFEIEEK